MRPLHRALWAGLALVAAASVAGRAGAADPPLERLLGDLLRAKDARQVVAALDALEARAGTVGGSGDLKAFGDLLGGLPEPRASDPRVLLRRGYAYLRAGAAKEAVAPLERAARDSEAAPVALAYLGEARRGSGDPGGALEALAAAAREGYTEPFLLEAALKAAYGLRASWIRPPTEGPPPYAAPIETFLAARPDALLEAALARFVLDDRATHLRQDADRARDWAALAAGHALAALRARSDLDGGARLAFDAAEALEDGPPSPAASLRFDLLTVAYRLGRGPDGDTHELPVAIVALAEAALAEGRYELAFRLARERLQVSDSPRARAVLDALPPDVGR